MPGRASSAASRAVAVGGVVEVDVAVDHGASQADDAAPAGAGHRQRLGVEPGQHVGRGEVVGEPAVRPGERLPVRRHQPAGDGAGAGHRDLLADHGAHRHLGAVDGAGDPDAGQRGDERAEQRVGAEELVDGGRVGVEVEQPAYPRDGRYDVARVLEAQGREDVVLGTGVEVDGGLAVREEQGAAERRAVVRLDAGQQLGRQQVEQPPAGERLAGREAQHHRAGDRGTAPGGGLLAQLARGGGEDGAHGVVELPDAREAGRERDLGQLEVGRLDEGAGGVRALRAGQCLGAGADLGDEQAVQLALAVAEPGGEAGHSLAVDRAVADQAHRPGDGVGADVPLR